jgi:hypothetical protein
MATYVLIRGARYGAWCWERLESLLLEQRQTAIAPDFPGMSSDDGQSARTFLNSNG